MDRIASPTRLDSRDLRLVLALATARSTAGAATSLHLTQPAVSRALLAAEHKLGVRLFERTPRGLEPTPAGHALLRGAPPLLAELQQLEAQLRAPATPVQPLRLVCECYTAYHWMPSAVRALQAALPGVSLQIALDGTRDPVAALLAGEIDVALISEAPTPRSRRLVDKPLFADEVVFVMAASHRLAALPALTRADLAGETLLTSRLPTRDMGWFHKPLAARRGEAPLHYQLMPLTEAVIDFARAGMGIGVLSEWVAEPHLRRGDVVARRLARTPLRRPWRLVWRKDVEPAALALWRVLQSAAPRLTSLPGLRAKPASAPPPERLRA
ncbi:LysR family transcriptional regulator [Ideonella sp. BN130291]|uniref:LysR family transcriptional regulator n=1 Tax=Ideonella sp. BN130291 TaxID=3112940 RepID=UPI002E257030|nr:LysR family transcriptional regulator [Ideonella sp. BN130291]